MEGTLHTHVANVVDTHQIPEKGTLSQTIYQDDLLKIVWFGFAPGEELSEHTASMPAIMHFLSGTARVTVDGETIDASPGTWIHMRPQCRHAIHANEKLIMLLTLVRAGRTPGP